MDWDDVDLEAVAAEEYEREWAEAYAPRPPKPRVAKPNRERMEQILALTKNEELRRGIIESYNRRLRAYNAQKRRHIAGVIYLLLAIVVSCLVFACVIGNGM